MALLTNLECHRGFFGACNVKYQCVYVKDVLSLTAGLDRDSSWEFSPFKGFWWLCDCSVSLIPRALVHIVSR